MVVKQVFAWYNEGPVSLGTLARKLNHQGTPSPAGQAWRASTLGRLLRQPAYKGTVYYGRHRADYSAIGKPRRQGQGTLRSPRYRLRPVEERVELTLQELIECQNPLEVDRKFFGC